MFNDFPLFPQAASTTAGQVDALYFFLVAVSGLMTLTVVVLILYFAVRYRRTPDNQIPPDFHPPKWLEYGVITVWAAVFLAMFMWGALVFFNTSRPPDDAMEIYGTGKQWMWKFQHLEGQREINELHVPVGRAVKVILSSEDVIHSFFVPAFRVKRDVLPHRYTTAWFQATTPGRYHLFCAEYCGTEHSGMIGWVTVMEPSEYQIWAAGGSPEGAPAVEGKKLFESFACNTCHTNDSQARGPVLVGLVGSTVMLQGGGRVVADENYLRESIEDPRAKVVAGFQPIMPTFKGQVNEAQLLQLIAYIKSLTPATPPVPAVGSPQSLQQPGDAGAGPPQGGPAGSEPGGGTTVPQPKTAPGGTTPSTN